MSGQNKGEIRKMLLFLCVFLICFLKGDGEKIRYFSAVECDRYSLDAVYNEKYKLITENIFKDCIEFVNSVSDHVAQSLTSIMAELPGRDVSDKEEKRVFTQFKGLKSAFSKRVQKIQNNITKSWETLIASNFDLLYDNDKSSLADYLNKTLNMTGAYSEARKSLDSTMESFVIYIKGTVRDGLQGISMAAENALKKDEGKKNSSEDAPGVEGQSKNENESREEKLRKKKIEIAEMVVKDFLGKVTVEVINRNMDLFKKSSVKPEDRDSVLDDLLFDILLMKNRIGAIIYPEMPKDKGAVDFARRSIYTYWVDLAEAMYQEKIKFQKFSPPGEKMYYQKLWSDESQLMETLLNLMEVY